MRKTAAGKHGENQNSSRDAGSRRRCTIDDGLRTAESELLVISPRVGALEAPNTIVKPRTKRRQVGLRNLATGQPYSSG